MADNYKISFIAQNDFEKHVAKTIANYNETLKSINLNNDVLTQKKYLSLVDSMK